MLTPHMGNAPDLSRIAWGADTGCFAAPERFDEAAYLAWLDRRPRETCLFATAPDAVRNAARTWELSAPVLPKIRALGFPAALVAQDGIEAAPIEWDAFDVLFIGGSNAWKLSAEIVELGREAKARGKYLHWGRVNSMRRFVLARKADADSADGTFLAFGPDTNLPRLLKWLDRVAPQRVLI